MEPHMEPMLPNPSGTPEQSPAKPKKPEAGPRPRPSSLEVAPSQPLEELRSVESHERQSLQPVVTNATNIASTLPVVIPTTDPVDDTTQALGQVATLTARDDDVIEKEWVNKSKKILKDTKGDPYRKEHEVSKLQADYMYKRYGKEVKIPDDV
jgi:hypothetical protein